MHISIYNTPQILRVLASYIYISVSPIYIVSTIINTMDLKMNFEASTHY